MSNQSPEDEEQRYINLVRLDVVNSIPEPIVNTEADVVQEPVLIAPESDMTALS